MYMRRAQKLDPDTKVGVWGITSSLAKGLWLTPLLLKRSEVKRSTVNCKPLASKDIWSISDVLFLLNWMIFLNNLMAKQLRYSEFHDYLTQLCPFQHIITEGGLLKYVWLLLLYLFLTFQWDYICMGDFKHTWHKVSFG